MDTTKFYKLKHEENEKKGRTIKILKPGPMVHLLSEVVNNVISAVILLLGIYITRFTRLLGETHSIWLEIAMIILVLSVVFLNIAKGISKLKDRENDTDEEK